MPDVRVTIDGIEISVPANSTILDAAKVAGINIPVLCAHPALDSIGACRMCLVEVEKQRVLQPACTFPVTEGMVVHTDSPKAQEAHKFVLQLLFSERNHFCMFCQMSGSCELQTLAYQNGLDHWEYDRAFPKLPVDASRDYFVMDHNRCILCRRCVRACDELVGNGTLGLRHRGTSTMIIADGDVPFGESSCIACGTCLQVCPTGALMDRASAYMGATAEVKRVKSRCTACSVGCGVELVVRENRVIRIEGDWDAEPNKGLLCELGRFTPLYDKRARARKPLVQGAEASWDEALAQAKAQISAAGESVCTVVSGFATTEAAQALAQRMPGQKVTMDAATINGDAVSLATLDEADLYIVIGVDLAESTPVAGMSVKRSVHHRGARLILIDDQANGLDAWAFAKWAPAEARQAAVIARSAQLPVIIYDAENAALAKTLANDLPQAKVFSFPQGGNALGLASAGINAPFAGQQAKVYYVVAGEAKPSAALMNVLNKASYVIVQTSFREPWSEVADVILPSPTTAEKSGTMINAEGRAGQIVAAISTKLPSEVQIIERLSA